MIVLIDNYDSFSYNLFQLVGGIDPDIKVIRNDASSIEEIFDMHPSHIIISPGPGRPCDAGVCEELIKRSEGRFPLLGVCLGHQAICEAFGGKITYAKKLMHGKKTSVKLNTSVPLFKGLPEKCGVARYHSLAASQDNFPECLEITGEAADGEIMAVRHKDFPIYGVQFHPESILTEHGMEMMKNFLSFQK